MPFDRELANQAYHFIEVNKMITDLFIEANKMDWVGTTLHLFMLKYSVCLSVKKYKECRFATALNDTHKENI